MNRVYLVVSEHMEATLKELEDGIAAAGLTCATYELNVNGAAAAAQIKSGNTAVLMETIAADFLMHDFSAVDAIAVTGAQGMSAVVAQKFNEALATALVTAIAGELAAAKTSAPGSYQIAFLDALAAIKPDDIIKRGHVKLIERAS